MNLCIYRTEQREWRKIYHYCGEDRQRCSGIRQAWCAVRDLWAQIVVFAVAVAGIVWALYGTGRP